MIDEYMGEGHMEKKVGLRPGLFFLILLPALLFITPMSRAEQKAATEKDRYGGTLVIGVDREPRNLDVRYLGGNWRERPGYNQIYDTLVDYGASGVKELVPMLATKWERVDEKSWLVYLRKGVKFHNGKEMTAEDVKTQLGWSIKKPEGWKTFIGAQYAKPLEKVEAIDRYTLKMTLKEPNYALFESFVLFKALKGLGYPEQIMEHQSRPVRDPIGTGPFKLVEWVSGDHITIERNEQYWGKRPYLDRVIFRIIPDGQTRVLALQKGEIDIDPLLSLQLSPVVAKDPRLSLVKVVRVRMGGVFYFNMRRWPMNDLKFRLAIAMGADWDKLARVSHPHNLGLMRRTYLEDSWAYNPAAKKLVLPYDPQKARKLIAEVEAAAGKKIPPLFTMVMKEELPNFVVMAAEELKKNLGIKCDVQALPYAVFHDLRRRDPKIGWDIMVGGGIGPEIDPHLCLSYYQSDIPRAIDGKNELGYNNPRVDQLINQGVTTMDRKKRIEIYQEVEKILFQDMPSVPIYNTPNLFGVSKRVHDFRPHNSAQIFLSSSWNNMWVDKK